MYDDFDLWMTVLVTAVAILIIAFSGFLIFLRSMKRRSYPHAVSGTSLAQPFVATFWSTEEWTWTGQTERGTTDRLSADTAQELIELVNIYKDTIKRLKDGG